ncbi:PREDICTED: SPRY domain-containing protein 7 [Pygoscelis adeliae]|uniref:SPRY domain-containing protein 7 n=1 Tax=Pygoscelis adeliae TaxID=9238 RepID=UPI0004F4F598|nr:PREDICTED: SPRY domain-containing protein 7 [Pygoscelis adeliae]
MIACWLFTVAVFAVEFNWSGVNQEKRSTKAFEQMRKYSGSKRDPKSSELRLTSWTGTDVVIVKNGRRICGTGGCLANAPLHQNKSYFEFKIQSTGIWGIGVATQKANLNQIPLGRDVHSLVMRNDGALYYNNEEKNRLPANNLPQEGDVVGITYDHVELNVYLNGKNMHCPASGIRGTVYPVVYVDDSAILDCQFSEFYHTPPPGFEKILFEQQIF